MSGDGTDQASGGFVPNEDLGDRGNTMASTAEHRLAESLAAVLSELSDRDAVKTALGLCATAGNTMSRQMTFESLLDFCTSTRSCWNVIHDASLFDVSGELLGVRDLVKELVAALEASEPFIDSLIRGLSDDREIELAREYQISIRTRCRFASILLQDDMEAVYVEMRRIARGDTTVPGDTKRVMSDKVRKGMLADRAGFVRRAFAWLRHKLVLLAAELRLEHGPWALASDSQRVIAVRTKDSVEVILRCMEELCSERKDGRVSPFLARLKEHLGAVNNGIVAPLQLIVDRLYETAPDRNVWVARRWEIEDVLRKDAESCITSLRDETVSLHGDVECWSRQLETLCGAGELSVLIYEEPYEGCDPWLAHGLELGLVAQGDCVESAIHNLSPLVDIRLEDIKAGAYSHPLPAEAEYFESFDAGKDWKPKSDLCERFPGINSVVIRQATEVPAWQW